MNQRTYATSAHAVRALTLVSNLQQRFVSSLEEISKELHCSQTFSPVEWCRDDGLHGGGIRLQTADGAMIGRGSVNVSQIHYDDNIEKKLGSATAISTIIHPNNPLSPSVHIHISWTEMKTGQGYWRIMADLNPSNENKAATAQFFEAMKLAAPEQYEEGVKQGEHYFFIPVLNRHRGVAHFYLEEYNTGDNEADFKLAKTVAEAAIDTYVSILKNSLESTRPATEEEKAKQLAYHTLYFFQVLTLDKGTTTGLLVHNQNDVGIMGSLPAYINRDLLVSWVSKMTSPQDLLLQALIDVLPTTSPCLINEAVKQQLAEAVRQHYLRFPEAIHMQASGHTTPSTIGNHK